MRVALPAAVFAIGLAACSPADDGETGQSQMAAATPSAAPAPAATASPAMQGREVSEQTDLYSFDYSYPAEAAAIPGLKAWLDEDLAKVRAELASEAAQARKEAKQNDFPFNTHDKAVGWQVVTDLPGWLSLSAGIGGYQGGAHPNHFFAALLWDKRTGKRREAADLFTSKRALSDALRKDFCREIDAQRREKRGEEYQQGGEGPFEECIDPTESTVILGSSNRRQFDRIGILVAPYAAGPYVEGDYEVTLPVTAAVLSAVRPEYRQDFALGR